MHHHQLRRLRRGGAVLATFAAAITFAFVAPTSASAQGSTSDQGSTAVQTVSDQQQPSATKARPAGTWEW